MSFADVPSTRPRSRPWRALLLSAVAAAAVAGPAAGDALAANQFSITGATVEEGNAGEKMLEFTIKACSGGTCSFNTLATYTVDWDTVEDGNFKGTADAGVDYTPVSGTLQWKPNGVGGTDPKTIQVPIKGDTALEPDENVYVQLTNPKKITPDAKDDGFGAVTAGTPGFGFIKNDDVAAAPPVPPPVPPVKPPVPPIPPPVPPIPPPVDEKRHSPDVDVNVTLPNTTPVAVPATNPVIVNAPSGNNPATGTPNINVTLQNPAAAQNQAQAPVQTPLGNAGNADLSPRRVLFDLVSMSRSAKVEVSCEGASSCSGTVRMRTRKRSRRVTLATRSYTLSAGQSSVLSVPLSRNARRLVSRSGSLTVVVTNNGRATTETFSV